MTKKLPVTSQPRQCSRRDFLKLSGLTAFSVGGMMFLTGCGPAAEGTVDDAGSSSDDSTSGSGTLGDGTTLRVGMEAVAVKLDFSALIDSLNNGQIDIVCAGMSVDPDRAESADFSDSYIDDDIVMITRSDSAYAGATTFADLAGASILGQAATMYDTVIDQIPDVNHMTPAETVPLVVENLSSGTCDIITYSMLSVPKLLETYPDFVELEMDDKFEGSVMPDNAAIAKGQDDVLEQINEIIAGISEDDRQQMWNECMDRQPA